MKHKSLRHSWYHNFVHGVLLWVELLKWDFHDQQFWIWYCLNIKSRDIIVIFLGFFILALPLGFLSSCLYVTYCLINIYWSRHWIISKQKPPPPEQSMRDISQREDNRQSQDLGNWNKSLPYLLGSYPQSCTHEFFPWSQYKLPCVCPRPHLLLFYTSLLPPQLVVFFHEEKIITQSHITAGV